MQNNSSLPLLSIVIPTRNRSSFVISAIQSILNIRDSRIELVIQDNSDSQDLELWIINNINDSRLVYNYVLEPLSFIDNFNIAIENSSGDYVCIIGDDDGVNAEIVCATEFLKTYSIDCMSIKNKANYVWPNSGIPTTIFTKNTGGFLTLSNFKGNVIEVNVENELNEFVRDGGAQYLNFNLPKLYHGIVKRTCLEKVKNRTGKYIGGLSPDIYISIAIACSANKVLITDYPLTIPGVCNVSASIIEGLLKKNSKKLEDAPHLRNRGSYNWSNLVPRVYTVETIWADSCIAALKDMQRDDLINRINISKLAAYCISLNNDIFVQVCHDLKISLEISNRNVILGFVKLSWNLICNKLNFYLQLLLRITRRFMITFGYSSVVRIDNLNSIMEASDSLTNYLNKKGFRFNGLK